MKDIIYSPLVSVILHIIMFSVLWFYWSLPSILIWAIFIVFYTEKRHNWRTFKKNQKI
jgi:hypothetical protein